MDSGNSSGSMQSSSGGEEEYDSRGESIPAFLNSNPGGDGAMPGLPRHHHQHLQHHQMPGLQSPASAMFDPLSNFFDPMTTRSALASLTGGPSPILNLDMTAWSKSPRPDPNCTDLGGFGLGPMQLQPLLGYNNQGQGRGGGGGTAGFPDPEGLRQLGSISGSAPNEQPPVTASNTNNGAATGNNALPRNPKKRSRASRRAPTTVLTTDTTNFRAMVQEFTGIPAPPFTASPFQRSRLDLFGSGSGAPSYLLRPFAQKLQPPAIPPFAPPPSSASSNSASSPFPTSIMDALASSAAGHSLANTDLGLLRSPPSFLNHNVPNQVLDFQSLFQSPGQKYSMAGSSMFPSKPHGSSDILGGGHNSHMRIGVLEEFGLSHGQVSTQLQAGLPNLEPLDRTLSENENNNNNKNNNSNNNDDNPHSNWHEDRAGSNDGSSQGMLRPLGGNFGRVGNTDRGPGTGSTRGEGMVESWICSSD